MARERIDGPTPAGGCYAEAFFMDATGNEVRKEQATHVAITEYTADGTWLAETFATLTPTPDA